MTEFKSAIITGPTGAIGTALCRLLLDKGITVYAVCRPGTERINQLPCGVDIISCDISELEKLPQMIQSADVFYHLGWAHTIGPGRNDMPSQIENIKYTIDAVSVAEKLGCRAFIGAGSQAEYGRIDGKISPLTPCFPENGYGMAKLCAGQMSHIECKKYGIRHIWMRVFSVYGPCDGTKTMVMSSISAFSESCHIAFTPGEQQWDYLYSDDAARAFYLAALNGQNDVVYTLGSGKTKTLKEYILTIAAEFNAFDKAGFGDMPYSDNQVMYLCADISDLKRDTGFEPSVCFNDGIKKTISWYKNN